MANDAFWYKNKKLIEVGATPYKTKFGNNFTEYGKTHIRDLIDNPEVFGYTEEKIKELYKKYDEEYGDEGKARHEIMADVISKGWIRVRHHRRRNADYWIIEFDNFIKRKKDLQNLISTLILDKGIMHKTDRVIFQGVEDNFQKVYDGFANPDNSVFLFLEGLKKEKVEVIKEYKYFDY